MVDGVFGEDFIVEDDLGDEWDEGVVGCCFYEIELVWLLFVDGLVFYSLYLGTVLGEDVMEDEVDIHLLGEELKLLGFEIDSGYLLLKEGDVFLVEIDGGWFLVWGEFG